MADFKILFKGAENSGTEDSEIEVFANRMNNITISLLDPLVCDDRKYPIIIQLSKSTAIKFHRELKKHISYLESEEVDNG